MPDDFNLSSFKSIKFSINRTLLYYNDKKLIRQELKSLKKLRKLMVLLMNLGSKLLMIQIILKKLQLVKANIFFSLLKILKIL